MYILICGFVNGDVEYIGPFPSRARAEAYAHVYEQQTVRPYRWHVKPVTIPYSVVQGVAWRIEEDKFVAKINPRRW